MCTCVIDIERFEDTIGDLVQIMIGDHGRKAVAGLGAEVQVLVQPTELLLVHAIVLARRSDELMVELLDSWPGDA